MEIDEDLGLASCGADAPDNTYKGVREIEVAVIVGSHAVEPRTHGESCKDLFGLIRVHHIDYGILSNRIIGDIQVAGVVVDDQAGGEASEGAVKGSISRLCARRSNLADFVAENQADEDIVGLVEREILWRFKFRRIEGRYSR